MAKRKQRKTILDNVLKVAISLDERVRELPTKSEVEKIVGEVLDERWQEVQEISKEVKAISKAVDKDAETIVRHEKRITRIESDLALK